MSLNAYIGDVSSGQKRPIPWAASVTLHATAFLLLMHSPVIRLEQSPSAYQQAIAGKETKLVWYKFDRKLPAIKPPEMKADRRPVRAEVRAPQAIVASRKDAPKRNQIIWTAAPELRQTKPPDLPNIVAIKLPEIARPFVTPSAAKPPDAPKIAVPDAPTLETKLDAVKLADAQRITRKFVPPPVKVPEKLKQVEAPSAAPQLEARALTSPLNESFKAPARPFTAPPTKAPPKIAQPSVADPPPDAISNSRELSAVVAGLSPSALPSILPANSSPAQFAAGPKVAPEGADAAGDRKGLAVPDLYVAGVKDAKTDLLAEAYAAPTSPESLRAAARLGNAHARVAGDDQSRAAPAGAVKVSGAPDKRFDGRDVYMMAIQMPNLTSYSGSWLMWYADRTARETGLAPISPPVAFRKVDPKYIASAAADRVEGRIQLACVIGRDGRVSTIELVRSLDERLNQAAEEALSKWEFYPATRHGEPVEVDVLVEIPFHLAPRTQYPY